MTDYSIDLVNAGTWATGDKLTEAQIDSLDANVKTAGDRLEALRDQHLRIAFEKVLTNIELTNGVSNPNTGITGLYIDIGSGSSRWAVYNAAASGTVYVYQSYGGNNFTATSCSGLATSEDYNASTMAGSNVILAPSSANGIYYSSNGTSFTLATAPAKTFTALFYDGTNAIAAASDGTFAFSTDDGLNWTASTTQPTNWDAANYDAAQMATSSGRVIAVPSDASATRFAYSDDNGDNWSEVVVTGLSSSYTGIAYKAEDTTWLAIGDNGTAAVVYKSTDSGATWSLSATLTGSRATSISTLWTHEEFFVTLLTPTAGGSRVMAFSLDGVTWYQGGTFDINNSESIKRLVRGNNQFAGVSSNPGTSAHIQLTPRSSTLPIAL